MERKNAPVLYQSLWSNCYYFFLPLITSSVTHLIIQGYTRQRCKTVIIQHSLYLNYDINNHLIFVILNFFSHFSNSRIRPSHHYKDSCMSLSTRICTWWYAKRKMHPLPLPHLIQPRNRKNLLQEASSLYSAISMNWQARREKKSFTCNRKEKDTVPYHS